MAPLAIVVDSEMVDKIIAELWVFLEDRGFESPRISIHDHFDARSAIVLTFRETKLSYFVRHFLMFLDHDCRWRRDHGIGIGAIIRHCDLEYVVTPEAGTGAVPQNRCTSSVRQGVATADRAFTLAILGQQCRCRMGFNRI
jgi:hypothetical protein